MSGDSKELLREEAHIWKIRMDGGLEAAERAEFAEWMAADTRNREFYAEAEMFASAFSIMPDLDGGRDTDDANEWIAEASLADAEVGRFAVSSRGPLLAGMFSVALMIAIAVITLSPWGPWATETRQVALYETPRAVTRIVNLPDGSKLTLSPETRLELELSENERRVRLLQGELFSAVTTNMGRPFLVETGKGIVEVTGTQFEVVARGENHFVTVTEGSVRASALEASLSVDVTPGERVRFLSETQLGPKEDVFQGEVASWRFGRLSFVRAPLSELVNAFNRYSEQPITFEPSVADEIVTGTFDASDIPAALNTLQEILPITIRAEGETTTIEPR